MFENRQDLALVAKPLQSGRVCHPEMEKLEGGELAVFVVVATDQVHGTHAARPNEPLDQIVPDPGADEGVARLQCGNRVPDQSLSFRPLEKPHRLALDGEQPFHFGQELGIVAAGARHEAPAVRIFEVAGRRDDGRHLPPAISFHGRFPPRSTRSAD